MTETWFHHVGYVVASIADSAAAYAEATGFIWDGEIIHDRLQMARVSFLRGGNAAGMIELVEPASSRSPVSAFLAQGGGIHHICLECRDLEASLAGRLAAGCTLVRVPLRAAAFEDRKIAWIRTPNAQLIELLQAGAAE